MVKVGDWVPGSDGERIEKDFEKWFPGARESFAAKAHENPLAALRALAKEAYFVGAGGELRRADQKQGAVMQFLVKRVNNGYVVTVYGTQESGTALIPEEYVVPIADPHAALERFAQWLGIPVQKSPVAQ